MNDHNCRISLNCYFNNTSYYGLWTRFCFRNISYLNINDKNTWIIMDSLLCSISAFLRMDVFVIWLRFILNFKDQASKKISMIMIKSLHRSLCTHFRYLIHPSQYFLDNYALKLSTLSSNLTTLIIWTQTSISSLITVLKVSQYHPIKTSFHYFLPNGYTNISVLSLTVSH